MTRFIDRLYVVTTKNYNTISTLYKSLPAKSSPACNVFTGRSLATASNSGDSSASAHTPFPAGVLRALPSNDRRLQSHRLGTGPYATIWKYLKVNCPFVKTNFKELYFTLLFMMHRLGGGTTYVSISHDRILAVTIY
jgi:hypothetical protein